MSKFMELNTPEVPADILVGMLFHFSKIQATILDRQKISNFRSFMIAEITNRQDQLEYKNCLRLIQTLPMVERGQMQQALAELALKHLEPEHIKQAM